MKQSDFTARKNATCVGNLLLEKIRTLFATLWASDYEQRPHFFKASYLK